MARRDRQLETVRPSEDAHRTPHRPPGDGKVAKRLLASAGLLLLPVILLVSLSQQPPRPGDDPVELLSRTYPLFSNPSVLDRLSPTAEPISPLFAARNRVHTLYAAPPWGRQGQYLIRRDPDGRLAMLLTDAPEGAVDHFRRRVRVPGAIVSRRGTTITVSWPVSARRPWTGAESGAVWGVVGLVAIAMGSWAVILGRSQSPRAGPRWERKTGGARED